jgi:hypothetical protein
MPLLQRWRALPFRVLEMGGIPLGSAVLWGSREAGRDGCSRERTEALPRVYI